VVYLLGCHVYGSQYVGESVQPFNKRMNEHRSDLTKKTFLPVNQHFVSPGHSLDDDTAALTSVSLMLLGRRNATTGGSGNNLANVSLFSISFQ
jgi:hypothetical protein